MKKIGKFMLIISLVTSIRIQGSISLVYNMRISETTIKLVGGTAGFYTFTVNPTYANGLTRKGTKGDFIGLLQTSAYATDTYFAKIEIAFGQATAAIPQDECWYNYYHTKSLTTDDILLKAGYSHSPHPQIKFSLAGQLGIPTHRNLVLQYFAIGYGHFGLGFQFDSRFFYSMAKKNALNFAFRLVQFIPRQALSTMECIPKCFKLNLGTLIDVLITHYSILGSHRFEIGYNQIFLCNGNINPFVSNAIEKFNFNRTVFFSAYSYVLSTKFISHIFLAGMSVGLDLWPWKVGNKRFVAPWLSYIINF